MSENTPGHIELAYSSIHVFADDGKIDLNELNFLLGIAMKDGQIDEDEKRVLGNIFKRIHKNELPEIGWQRIQAIKQRHGIE